MNLFCILLLWEQFTAIQTGFSLSVCLFLRLLFIYLHIAAFFIDAEKLAALLHHQSAAFWAGFRRRLLPGHEITFRIILAAVIFSSLLRFSGSPALFRTSDRLRRFSPGKASCFCTQESLGRPGNFPCGPYLITIIRPHRSQGTSLTSSAILTASSFFSASVTASSKSG